MNFKRLNLESCHDAHGLVVVIDVLRAFSTACYAFARGSKEIIVTDTVESAFAIKTRFTGSLVMGEDGGYPIPGFDYSNSPFEISHEDLVGATLIQRTSAGTQGVVRCRNAKLLVAASFCNASATIRHIQSAGAETVSLVATGGDEDTACADLIQLRLEGERPSFQAYAKRIRGSKTAQKFLDPSVHDFYSQDLELCLSLDVADFSMIVEDQDDLLVLKRVGVSG
jgi:2-phosphosulfolactate phosphatase